MLSLFCLSGQIARLGRLLTLWPFLQAQPQLGYVASHPFFFNWQNTDSWYKILGPLVYPRLCSLWEEKYNNLWAFRAQYGIINSDRGGGSDLLPLPHSHGYRSTEQLFEQNLYFSHVFVTFMVYLSYDHCFDHCTDQNQDQSYPISKWIISNRTTLHPL